MAKVLIVHNSIKLCHKIKEGLDKSFDVYFAHNCEDALKICSIKDIDLLLASLSLSSGELSEMIKHLRDHYPEKRVIAVSDHMMDENLLEAMMRIGSLGVNQLIQYPMAAQEVHDAVDKELSSYVSFE